MKKFFTALAIIVIIGIVYVVTMVLNTTVQDKNVKDFNAQFEKYNKQELYGADIISAINKAISNNDSYKLTENDDTYYINIKLNIIDEGFDIKTDMNAISQLR